MRKDTKNALDFALGALVMMLGGFAMFSSATYDLGRDVCRIAGGIGIAVGFGSSVVLWRRLPR